MGENLLDIDKLFHDALDRHEEQPPSGVWDAIDKSLDKNKVISINKKYRDIKRLAVAMAIVMVGTIAWSIYSHNKIVATSTAFSHKKQSASEPASTLNNIIENRRDNASANKTNTSSKPEVSTLNHGKPVTVNSTLKNRTNQIAPIKKSKENEAVAVEQNDQHHGNKVKNSRTNYHKNDAGNQRQPATNVVNDLAIAGVARKTGKAETTAHLENDTRTQNSDELISSAKQNEQAAIVNAGSESLEGKGEVSGVKHFSLAEPLVTEREAFDESSLKSFNLNDKSAFSSPSGKNISFHPTVLKVTRLSIMPFYAPQVSENRIEDGHQDGRQPPDHDRDEIRRTEQQQHGYAFGVNAFFTVGKNWSLQSGVSYMVKNTSIDPKRIFARPDDNGDIRYRYECSAGYAYLSPKNLSNPSQGDSIVAGASKNTLGYITVPVAVNYRIRVGKFGFLPTAGASVNFLVKQKIQTELQMGNTKVSQTVTNIQGLNPNYFTGLFAVGLEYNFSRRLAVNLTPALNFALSSINKNAAVKSYPTALSLNTGLRFNF